MQVRRFDLADLLTASGAAMASSNQRLASVGAPALLREFTLALDFEAAFGVKDDACTLLFGRVAKADPHILALTGAAGNNIRIEATYIAAPSLVPAPVPVPVCTEGGGV